MTQVFEVSWGVLRLDRDMLRREPLGRLGLGAVLNLWCIVDFRKVRPHISSVLSGSAAASGKGFLLGCCGRGRSQRRLRPSVAPPTPDYRLRPRAYRAPWISARTSVARRSQDTPHRSCTARSRRLPLRRWLPPIGSGEWPKRSRHSRRSWRRSRNVRRAYGDRRFRPAGTTDSFRPASRAARCAAVVPRRHEHLFELQRRGQARHDRVPSPWNSDTGWYLTTRAGGMPPPTRARSATCRVRPAACLQL